MNKTIKKELLLLEDLGMKYPKETSKEKKRYGLYKCHCGKEFETQTRDVKSGRVKSCGCEKIHYKHRLSRHRLYGTWNQMIKRCCNEKNDNYNNYGGKGITVCERWLNIENFINDMYPSFKEGLTLDRIDVNGNYEKSNCRWADKYIQAQNTRKIYSHNTSGYRGVHFHKRDNKWIAQVSKKTLGSFNTSIEAAKARDKYIIDNNLEHTLNFK